VISKHYQFFGPIRYSKVVNCKIRFYSKLNIVIHRPLCHVLVFPVFVRTCQGTWFKSPTQDVDLACPLKTRFLTLKKLLVRGLYISSHTAAWYKKASGIWEIFEQIFSHTMPYLPTQSQALYHTASSGPSARHPFSCFDDNNEEANWRTNIDVAARHADVCAIAVVPLGPTMTMTTMPMTVISLILSEKSSALHSWPLLLSTLISLLKPSIPASTSVALFFSSPSPPSQASPLLLLLLPREAHVRSRSFHYHNHLRAHRSSSKATRLFLTK